MTGVQTSALPIYFRPKKAKDTFSRVLVFRMSPIDLHSVHFVHEAVADGAERTGAREEVAAHASSDVAPDTFDVLSENLRTVFLPGAKRVFPSVFEETEGVKAVDGGEVLHGLRGVLKIRLS